MSAIHRHQLNDKGAFLRLLHDEQIRDGRKVGPHAQIGSQLRKRGSRVAPAGRGFEVEHGGSLGHPFVEDLRQLERLTRKQHLHVLNGSRIRRVIAERGNTRRQAPLQPVLGTRRFLAAVHVDRATSQPKEPAQSVDEAAYRRLGQERTEIFRSVVAHAARDERPRESFAGGNLDVRIRRLVDEDDVPLGLVRGEQLEEPFDERRCGGEM